VSRYQEGKTNLDFTGARDSEWQWHQLGYMQVCTSLQTDNHASIPPLKFSTGRMPNQQCQSTEGNSKIFTTAELYEILHHNLQSFTCKEIKIQSGIHTHKTAINL